MLVVDHGFVVGEDHSVLAQFFQIQFWLTNFSFASLHIPSKVLSQPRSMERNVRLEDTSLSCKKRLHILYPSFIFKEGDWHHDKDWVPRRSIIVAAAFCQFTLLDSPRQKSQHL